MRGKRKGTSPVFAVLFLAAAGVVSVISLVGMRSASEAAPAGDGELAFEEPVAPQQAAEPDDIATNGIDLLAAYGSFAADFPVRLAFVAVAPADAVAVPLGETAAMLGIWAGADPPALRLGVVMISGTARRAVLGGQVVGLGDEVQGACVRSIERGRVVVSWGARTLTYDLEDCWPREFRAEHARRAAESAVGDAATAGVVGPEVGGAADAGERIEKMLRAQERR